MGSLVLAVEVGGYVVSSMVVVAFVILIGRVISSQWNKRRP